MLSDFGLGTNTGVPRERWRSKQTDSSRDHRDPRYPERHALARRHRPCHRSPGDRERFPRPQRPALASWHRDRAQRSDLVIDAQGGLNALGELFRIDPQTGDRTLAERLQQGTDRGITPTSVQSRRPANSRDRRGLPTAPPLGLLFRIDPQSGTRTVLSDFNTGANTGRDPEGVAIEANGQILVIVKQAGPLSGEGALSGRPADRRPFDLSDFGVGPNGGGEPQRSRSCRPRRDARRCDEVVNDNGGSAVVSDWTMSVPGSNPPASFPGARAGRDHRDTLAGRF